MRYSFIHPKPKQIVDSDTKIILIFFVITIALTIGFAVFVMLKKDNFAEEAASMKREIVKFRSENSLYKKKIDRIERLVQKFESIQTHNTL